MFGCLRVSGMQAARCIWIRAHQSSDSWVLDLQMPIACDAGGDGAEEGGGEDPEQGAGEGRRLPPAPSAGHPLLRHQVP